MINHKLTIHKKTDQKGFTIIELLIATIVFTVVLIILVESLLSITNSYYKGITESNTQNTARNVINAVAQAIEFNGGVPTATVDNGQSQGYCIGGQLFSYIIGDELEDNPDSYLSQTPDALVVSSAPGCSSETAPQDLLGGGLSTGSNELLSPNMRLASFSITPVDNVNYLYEVNVRVVYGATDLLSAPSGNSSSCLGGDGDQFCAVSELSSIVQMRVR